MRIDTDKSNTLLRVKWATHVALLVGHQTCDSQVAGSTPGWAPPCSVLGKSTYICVPLYQAV